MKIEEYSEKLGFKKDNNSYILDIDGYRIYLKYWNYLLYKIPAFYIPLNEEVTKNEIKRIEENVFGNVCSIGKFNNKKNILIVTLEDGNKNNIEVLNKIKAQMTNAVKTLKNDGYTPMKLCPICNNIAEYKSFIDISLPIHDNCLLEYKEKIKKIVNDNNKLNLKNILLTLVGIIMIIIGIIPSLLFMIFNNNYITVLLALSVLLLGLTYKLLKLPRGKKFNIILGISNFIIVLGFVIFSLFYISNKMEITIIEYLTINNLEGIRKFIFGLLFSIGGFGSIKIINKLEPNYKEELDNI